MSHKAWLRALVAYFALGPLACATGTPLVPPPREVPLAPPNVTPGTLDARELLKEPAERATAAGAGPISIVATGEAAERERLGAFVDVPEAVCLLGYARASASVEDLDLAAFAEDGAPAAVDDAPDAHPTLLVCPPHPSRVFLAAVAASGEGLIAVGAQLVPVARAPLVGKVMAAHGTRTASTRAAEAWPGLDDLVRRHHDAIRGSWEVLRKVAISVDARVPAAVAFPMETDGCTDALVIPDDDVTALDVEVLDDRGRVVARGPKLARQSTVTVCSPVGWNGTLTVRPHVGQGLVAVVLSRGRGETAKDLATEPDVAWVAATLPLEKAQAKRESALRAAGYGAAIATETALADVGRAHTSALSVADPHGCSRVDVVGGAPTALLDVVTWDAMGNRVASADGAGSATVFVCGRERLRLDVEARARPGPYGVTLRHETWVDPAFDVHPVAAARMLTRAAVGPAGVFEGGKLPARAVSEVAGHETSWSQVIPAGACLRTVVGSEGGGAGLVGRVVDGTSGDEIDRIHAAESIALRACAPENEPRQVIVSVVVTAGRLDLVIGERLVR